MECVYILKLCGLSLIAQVPATATAAVATFLFQLWSALRRSAAAAWCLSKLTSTKTLLLHSTSYPIAIFHFLSTCFQTKCETDTFWFKTILTLPYPDCKNMYGILTATWCISYKILFYLQHVDNSQLNSIFSIPT